MFIVLFLHNSIELCVRSQSMNKFNTRHRNTDKLCYDHDPGYFANVVVLQQKKTAYTHRNRNSNSSFDSIAHITNREKKYQTHMYSECRPLSQLVSTNNNNCRCIHTSINTRVCCVYYFFFCCRSSRIRLVIYSFLCMVIGMPRALTHTHTYLHAKYKNVSKFDAAFCTKWHIRSRSQLIHWDFFYSRSTIIFIFIFVAFCA